MMQLKVTKSFFRTYGLDFALVGIFEGYELLTLRRAYTVLDYIFISVFSTKNESNGLLFYF